MSTTLQTIKEESNLLQNNNQIDNSSVKLPDLEIREIDRNLYAECVVNGSPFYQVFKNDALNFSVIIRDKTKRESDIIARQTDKSYNDGKLYSVVEYTNTFNIGCLYYQLEEYNGVKQNREYPANVWDMKDFDLLSVIDKSTIGQASSSMMYILMGMLSQFNKKLYSLALEILDPSFSRPAKGS